MVPQPMTTAGGSDIFYSGIPVFRGFGRLMDPAPYSPLPDDWTIGVADIVESTKAIAQARYKAVNMAGAVAVVPAPASDPRRLSKVDRGHRRAGDAAKTPLLRMRKNHTSFQRLTRVQFSPPQSGPTQPSTLSVSGPDTEMLLA